MFQLADLFGRTIIFVKVNMSTSFSPHLLANIEEQGQKMRRDFFAKPFHGR